MVDCIKTHSVTGYSKTCTVFLVKGHTRFFEAMYGPMAYTLMSTNT